MSNDNVTWVDWADDHPEEAARWEEQRRLAAQPIEDRDGADSAAMYAAERQQCEHEDVDNQGVCRNCGDEIEGWEPTDAQIFAQYGQTMNYDAA